MALGLTKPLIEISTRNLPGRVKSGRRVRLNTSPPSVSRCLENVRLDNVQSYRPPWPITEIALLYCSHYQLLTEIGTTCVRSLKFGAGLTLLFFMFR
jgi:hypothetical protein